MPAAQAPRRPDLGGHWATRAPSAPQTTTRHRRQGAKGAPATKKEKKATAAAIAGTDDDVASQMAHAQARLEAKKKKTGQAGGAGETAGVKTSISKERYEEQARAALPAAAPPRRPPPRRPPPRRPPPRTFAQAPAQLCIW